MNFKAFPRRVAALALALALTPAWGGAAFAQSGGAEMDGAQGGPGAQGVGAQAILATGGAIDRVALVTETVANVYTPGGVNPPPGTFVNLPGAVVTMDVPAGQSRLFLAQFSSESECYSAPGVVTPSWCSVRILFSGVEGNPAAGTDFAFDSTELGDEVDGSWESHAMQRSRRITNTGTVPLNVQIVVQRTTTDVSTSLRLDDWHLTVMRFM